MHLIGLARLGKDAELRFLQDGTPVCNMALAFNYGQKNSEGKRPTQWIDAALWGKRAEGLAQYLVKGQAVVVHLADPHIETYTSRDGSTGSKLVANVDIIEFAGPAPQNNGQQAQQQGRAPNMAGSAQGRPSEREQARDRQYAATSQGRGESGFDDLEAPF